MGRKLKYSQNFVDKVHLMKNNHEKGNGFNLSKSQIAKKLNATVSTITYILDKRKPSVQVEYEKVEQASKMINTIWKRIKKRFPFLRK
jgi:orotate phosphoribosyltransferase-like protein|tara:strand:+ start:361 stop:624 length:264 start_codon:yes stop_codon:yes gene_type:complete